ncbi:MAG: phosphoenolpyruvate carboxylase [Anaerolineales bacterium]|nr:phosphoenolpyruvate carboxylase [Anaerolineales bacterium]MDW8161281.1 phosphoenolpyruvate carboxylase [Anaerolineales bacterium]
MPHIPRCMSTQHPDNVQIPFFASDAELQGEDEVQEAYYVFSHLGCDEQMWDYEGKEVDNFVVKKLLSTYEPFFRQVLLGEHVFITPRVPNPAIEKTEAKILLETLGSIPRSYDAALLFNPESPPPIFEVILPMTVSAADINRIYNYYVYFVAAKDTQKIPGDTITIGEWLGSFRPQRINVIPLFEGVEHLLNAAKVVEEFLRDKDLPYQRVFLARSDPAMNSGLISTILANKIALYQLDQLSQQLGIELYPILGMGSAPFRGNLKPTSVERIAQEFPSVQTFTIQSAFKYDYPPLEVVAAIQKLKAIPRSRASEIDQERSLSIMQKTTQAYREQVTQLAPLISTLAKYVPRRRKRKSHSGLFGYFRNVSGIQLPRAIAFTCTLYSLGIPPELLGLHVLTHEEIEFLRQTIVNFEVDLAEALQYVDLDNPYLPSRICQAVERLQIAYQPNQEHLRLSREITEALRHNHLERLGELILRAASLRRFLG